MLENDTNREERLRQLFSLYRESVSSRFGILPVISTLAAALLVIATFNQELVPLNFFVRAMLTVLLLLVPTSLFFYLYAINELGNSAQKALEKEIKRPLSIVPKKSFRFIATTFPYTAFVILTTVIVIMNILIWRNEIKGLLYNIGIC